MKWVPKSKNENVKKRVSFGIDNVSRITNIVQLILFIVDSGCTKHMMGNLKLLCNFVEKYLGFITSKASITISSWLVNFKMRIWRLSHLNFDYINLLSKKDIEIGLPKLKYVKDQLCSSCKVSKAKISSFKTKAIPGSKGRLNLLHIDLCGPMWVDSINRKKYIQVIVDDYSIYTWTLFLQSKDETPEVLKDFLKMIQRNLQAHVISVRTDRASKLPLFFWAEAIATACYTQNRSIIIPTHENTAYHIIINRKPSNRHLYIFGCTCYLTRDGENLDKMKEKGDPCILILQGSPSLLLLCTILFNKTTTPYNDIQSSTEPTTLTTNVNAEENNDNQAADTQFQQDEFINPFCKPIREIAESS
ncbi:retrovirus-related pol polyprotein from transposon TNT 1-94 [Tanacetum coccineum]